MVGLLVCFICHLLLAVVAQQTMTGIPISRVDYSFPLGNPSSMILVELTIDLGCSNCMDAWPMLSEVVELYKEEVHFKIRILPLPYHQQSFILSKAASTVFYYKGDRAAIDYMNNIMENQALYYNSATADKTYNEVVRMVAEAATNGTDLSSEDFYEGMDARTVAGNTIEMFTRYEWKYNVVHGQFGTPFYQINGLVVEGLQTVDQWKETLDPLVKTQRLVEAPKSTIYL